MHYAADAQCQRPITKTQDCAAVTSVAHCTLTQLLSWLKGYTKNSVLKGSTNTRFAHRSILGRLLVIH